MLDYVKVLNERRAEIAAKVDAYNAAVKKNDFDEVQKAENELRAAEKEYAAEKQAGVFQALKETENPIKSAVEQRSFFVVSHKVERDDNGKPVSCVMVEDRERMIDLVKFCKFAGLDTMWQYKVQKANQLLAMRAANELGWSKKEIRALKDSFFMDAKARELEMGETPDSNSQICKILQEVFDSILFLDNGKGKNTYKVLNRDVAYILSCYTKRNNKKALTVSVAKNGYMHTLLVDIMHRIVTGKVYGLDYQMVKPADAKKVSEPKTTEPAAEEVAA